MESTKNVINASPAVAPRMLLRYTGLPVQTIAGIERRRRRAIARQLIFRVLHGIPLPSLPRLAAAFFYDDVTAATSVHEQNFVAMVKLRAINISRQSMPSKESV